MWEVSARVEAEAGVAALFPIGRYQVEGGSPDAGSHRLGPAVLLASIGAAVGLM
jgi:hypothetical protein